MIVRFGGIRDRDQNPRDILWESFRLADCGWRITTVKSAGLASHGKRQAEQFLRRSSQSTSRKPIAELDVYVQLDR